MTRRVAFKIAGSTLGLTGALIFLVPAMAAASLSFDSSLGGISGSGLGTVATVLTLTSPAQTSTESASVARSGGVDVTSNTGAFGTGSGTVNFGTVQTGASQTLTRALSEIGITSQVGQQLGIVLNTAEPAGNSITLTGLELDIFNGDTNIFSARLDTASVAFATTFTGVGNEGFAFRLDNTQANQLNSVISGLGLSSAQIGALRIGLSASLSDATGGLETFNVSRITRVPEPASLLLLGAGLIIAIGAARLHRRRQPS